MYVYPFISEPQHPTIFRQNSASYGGGLHSFYSNPATVLVNTVFDSNRALTDDGGGVYVEMGSSIVTFVAVTFKQNTAFADGGGVAFISGSFGVQVVKCTFLENSNKQGNGGGLYLGTLNGIGVLKKNNFIALEWY